jgi:Flp pilus assembly protein TadD
MGEHDKAVAALEKAVLLNTKDVNARLALSGSYLKESRATDAVDVLNAALKVEPDNAYVHFQLASAYFSCELDEFAEVHSNRAVELDPSLPRR